jgi:3-dehydroquinate dehydratase-2
MMNAIKKPIFILTGPNLNMLGRRDPQHYGTETLAEIESNCRAHATNASVTIDFRQSNHEGVLIDWVHEAFDKAAAVIINPGAYAHTSIALMDALDILTIPVVEVHLSNIHQREEFRRQPWTSKVADEVIVGHKGQGYLMAIDAAIKLASGAKSA